MTFCHIQLRKITEDNDTVRYAAYSPDFNDKREDENLAEIIINKSQSLYEFLPGKTWISQRTLPPQFYSFSEEEQNKMIENEYKGYGNGAWTMRINRWVNDFIQRKIFPDKYPK